MDKVKNETIMKEDNNDNDYFFITFINEKILLKNIEEDQYCYKFAPQEVSFDSDEYIRNIYNSYKMNWENIYSQYKKDFARQDLLINKSLVSNPVLFEDFVSKFQEYIFCDDPELFYDKLFIMLATQSSYYFMYLYSKTFENKFRKLYGNPDLYIVNGPNKAIHFETIQENEISFKAFLTLFVKDVNDDKKVFNVIYLELNIIFKIICNNNSIYTTLIDFIFNNKKKNDTNYGTLVINIV